MHAGGPCHALKERMAEQRAGLDLHWAEKHQRLAVQLEADLQGKVSLWRCMLFGG